MKKEFIPKYIKDPKIRSETLEIEVLEKNIVIDKAEIKEFLEEAL